MTSRCVAGTRRIAAKAPESSPPDLSAGVDRSSPLCTAPTEHGDCHSSTSPSVGGVSPSEQNGTMLATMFEAARKAISFPLNGTIPATVFEAAREAISFPLVHVDKALQLKVGKKMTCVYNKAKWKNGEQQDCRDDFCFTVVHSLVVHSSPCTILLAHLHVV